MNKKINSSLISASVDKNLGNQTHQLITANLIVNQLSSKINK